MKKIFLLFTIVFAFASCSKNTGDLLEDIKNKGVLTVAMEGTWAPWTYHDEAGELIGFDTEVATAIAEKLGVKAEFVEGEWDGLFAGLDSKRYDIVVNGVEFTAERAEKYDFTTPYGYINTALIVKNDNDTIKTFEDLKGKTTVNSIASTYMILAENYGAKVLGVDSLDQTIADVLAGRADATLNADVSFYDYMKVHSDAPLKVVAKTAEPSLVVIPVRKGEANAKFLAALNKAIDELRAEGRLSEISIKYFGNDITGASN